MNNAKAFTLVEILVVVIVLGIMAAIVIPTVSSSTIPAKESSLASDLQLLRRLVLIFKSQHLEVGLGYPNGNTTLAPTEQDFIDQATMSSNTSCQTAPIGTPGFDRGTYLQKIPVNPFNGLSTIQMLGNGEDFPVAADDSHGWIYKAATSDIRADNSGADDNGKAYYDY
jgi:prepilin-type N-terminal cleavage/methylation domain-containing protein